jgi:hypothetical protein
MDIEKYNWSEWRPFPDPRKEGILNAPYGCGLYQLKDVKSKEYILFGVGKNCAFRMSSLLPKPYGQGTRNNEMKRQYVFDNIESILYRTLSFLTEKGMNDTETAIRKLKIHKFNT